MKKLNKITVILLALMLTCVIAITASFSWLTRPNGTTDNANAIGLTGTAVVKTIHCTSTTYTCSMVNGALEEIVVATSGAVTIPANSTQYFKTVITNNAESKNNISLTNLQLSGGTGATVNCLSPLKTSVAYSEGVSVADHLTIDASGTLTVEWYICNKGSAEITVTNVPEIFYYS